MDKPSFLVFSIIGMMTMVILHLSEVWLLGSAASLTAFMLEWLPLYLVWLCMLFIGLFKRAS